MNACNRKDNDGGTKGMNVSAEMFLLISGFTSAEFHSSHF